MVLTLHYYTVTGLVITLFFFFFTSGGGGEVRKRMREKQEITCHHVEWTAKPTQLWTLGNTNSLKVFSPPPPQFLLFSFCEHHFPRQNRHNEYINGMAWWQRRCLPVGPIYMSTYISRLISANLSVLGTGMETWEETFPKGTQSHVCY